MKNHIPGSLPPSYHWLAMMIYYIDGVKKKIVQMRIILGEVGQKAQKAQKENINLKPRHTHRIRVYDIFNYIQLIFMGSM